jgi:hypothetical protein
VGDAAVSNPKSLDDLKNVPGVPFKRIDDRRLAGG